jgi:hypothetical protein
MKTTIETTDYIHQTGLPMVSLKTVDTTLPAGWGNGYSDVEQQEMVQRMHAADVEIEQYRGRIAEGKGDADNLAYVLKQLEDADQDAYLSICDDIAKDGIDSVAR